MAVYLAGLLGWLIFPRVCQLLISKQRQQFRHTLSGSRVQKSFPQNSIVSPPFSSVLRMLDTNCYPINVSLFQQHADHVFFRRGRSLGTSRFSYHCLSTENYSSVERVKSVRPFQRFPMTMFTTFCQRVPTSSSFSSFPTPPPHIHSTLHSRQFWKYFFLNCWRFLAFPTQDVYGRRNVFLIPPSPAKCQMKRSNYGS